MGCGGKYNWTPYHAYLLSDLRTALPSKETNRLRMAFCIHVRDLRKLTPPKNQPPQNGISLFRDLETHSLKRNQPPRMAFVAFRDLRTSLPQKKPTASEWHSSLFRDLRNSLPSKETNRLRMAFVAVQRSQKLTPLKRNQPPQNGILRCSGEISRPPLIASLSVRGLRISAQLLKHCSLNTRLTVGLNTEKFSYFFVLTVSEK
ncbi:hypothetical protein AVEN_17889-1 [Araneus ventricosus]|uniref:Uncharacterized protein n=1 Tax=Araneus ventricosus TaxID=182803 RepID=A0A4Y2I5R1_ARAVE|nr:hypothetical protein AVEN_17889-1 [Araneus ventricosus]